MGMMCGGCMTINGAKGLATLLLSSLRASERHRVSFPPPHFVTVVVAQCRNVGTHTYTYIAIATCIHVWYRTYIDMCDVNTDNTYT